MTTKQNQISSSKIIVLTILVSSTLAWSKCKSGECKSCTNRGCEKCFKMWSNLNLECVTFSTNTPNCLNYNATTSRCQDCNEGFYISGEGGCAAVDNSQCADGVFLNNTLKCTSCLNGKYANAQGQCTQTIPKAMTGKWAHCVNANMSYSGNIGQSVTQFCAECDYGYALNEMNQCVVSCSEGCMKCNKDHLCEECNWRKGWWSTSPHNCTNPNFNYYDEWNRHEGKILQIFATALFMIGFSFLG